MSLKDDLKKFVTEQFLTNERVKKEVETIYPFFKEMNVPMTQNNIDVFLTHLKDSIVSSLVLYSEDNKILAEDIENKKEELKEVILKGMDTAKLTFGFLIQQVKKRLDP